MTGIEPMVTTISRHVCSQSRSQSRSMWSSCQHTHCQFLLRKAEQTILARFRLGHCALAASMSRWSPLRNRICACGSDEETVAHFLLRCPLYFSQRNKMISEIFNVLNRKIEITEDILLGFEGRDISLADRCRISEVVFKFADKSGREI